MLKTRRFSAITAFAAVFALAMAGLALADVVVNNVTAGGTDTITAGGSTTVGYKINATGGDGQTGCNAADGSPATVTIGAHTGVTMTGAGTPGTGNSRALVFQTCNVFQHVTFASSRVGNYAISSSVSDTGAGTYSNNANWTLVVNPAAGDTTSPTNASVGINNAAAWTNNAAVSLALSATDNLGITSYRLAETQEGLETATAVAVSPAQTSFSSSPVSFTLTGGDGSSKAVWIRVFDAAGNSADASDTIGLDTVKPTITSSTGSYTPGTWTNQNVTVSFSCADNAGGSGLATNTVAGTTLSTSGAGQQATNSGGCTDHAANSADAVAVTNINIDKVKPYNVTFVGGGLTDGLTYGPGAVPAGPTGCTADDALSQLDGCELSGTYSTNLGQHTLMATATDNAGNTETSTLTYRVRYTTTEFSAPVNKAPWVNKAKAGKAVPLKWRVTDGLGNGVSTLTNSDVSVTVRGKTCDLGSSEDAIEEYSAGGTGLQNLGNGYYQWDWKSPTTYAGSCKTLTVNIPGGGGPTADFSFTK